MSGIKYYQLGDGEELPEEFCAIRNVNGEPDEYAWYEPMDAFDRKLWGIFKDNDWVVASEYRKLKAENAKLREQMERLVTLLRNDCDIDASWDGLRRFWSIELTEGGCLMRDRACKAEADVAKLFALLKHESEQTEKLRELVRDMWEFGFGDNSGANNAWAWHERTDELEGRMRELGVEI